MVLYQPNLTAGPARTDGPTQTRAPFGSRDHGQPHRPRGRVPSSAFAVVLTAGVAVAGIGIATRSWAAPETAGACEVDQLMVSLVEGAPHAGQGAAQIQYTARTPRPCTLAGPQPVSLVGADGVTIVSDFSVAPPVTVSPGHPAHETLRWNLSTDPAHRAKPTALLAQTGSGRGNPRRWAWRLDPISTAPGQNALHVSSVHPGAARPTATAVVPAS